MDGFAISGLEANASQDLSKTQLDRAKRLGESKQVTKAAKEFEKLMSTMLVKEMRKSVKDLIPGDSTDSLGVLFDEQIGKQVASGGGLGIANQLARYMEAQGG